MRTLQVWDEFGRPFPSRPFALPCPFNCRRVKDSTPFTLNWRGTADILERQPELSCPSRSYRSKEVH